MKKECDIAGSEKGSALVTVILVVIALSVIVIGVTTISVDGSRSSPDDRLEKQVSFLAEAGLERSLRYLGDLDVPFSGSGSTGDEPVMLYDGVELYDKGKVTSYLDPLDSGTGNPTCFVNVTVRATLEGTGISKVLQVKVGQQNFSRYAYFSDQERSSDGSIIWFYDNDVFHGPVHTNCRLHIYGNPRFYEEVSSSAPSIEFYHGGDPADKPVFHKGVTMNAPVIELPGGTGMLRSAASEPGGIILSGDPVRIEFMVDADGHPLMQVEKDGAAVIMSCPDNGVIYVEGTAHVQGTVKGQITVGCDGDIFITDNLVYYSDPRIDPESADLCGLVAGKNVIMARNAANEDSADETVMAAIMALGTSWKVEEYQLGRPRGRLIVYGGIVQRERGAVGTFNSYGIASGYDKDYSYDRRLMDNPPPAFPTTGQVERIAVSEIDPRTDIGVNFW